jgi:hypothetical protein
MNKYFKTNHRNSNQIYINEKTLFCILFVILSKQENCDFCHCDIDKNVLFLRAIHKYRKLLETLFVSMSDEINIVN